MQSMAVTKIIRRLRKGEVRYIRDCLQDLDLEVMGVFVLEEVESAEFHVACLAFCVTRRLSANRCLFFAGDDGLLVVAYRRR